MSKIECPRCGRECRGRNGLGVHYGKSHEGHHWLLDEHGAEEFHRLYVSEQRSENQLSEHFGVSRGVVKNALESEGIERRGMSEAESVRWGKRSEEEKQHIITSASEGRRKKRATFGLTVNGYEQWSSSYYEDGKQVRQAVYVHRLLAVAEYGVDAVADKVVHHTNHVTWDNRPENIRLMTWEEHGALHAEKRKEQEVYND